MICGNSQQSSVNQKYFMPVFMVKLFFCLSMISSIVAMEDGYIPRTDVVDDLIAVEKINNEIKEINREIDAIQITLKHDAKAEKKLKQLKAKRNRLVGKLIREN